MCVARLIKDADKLISKDEKFVKEGVILETRDCIKSAEFWGIDGTGDWEFEIDGKPISFPAETYLGTWRCWDGMPTEEERANVPFDPVFGVD